VQEMTKKKGAWENIGRLLRLITVASSFPSARLTHKIPTCHEQRFYEMWRVSATRRETFPAPSLNMKNENLKHCITAGEPRYTRCPG